MIMAEHVLIVHKIVRPYLVFQHQYLENKQHHASDMREAGLKIFLSSLKEMVEGEEQKVPVRECQLLKLKNKYT